MTFNVPVKVQSLWTSSVWYTSSELCQYRHLIQILDLISPNSFHWSSKSQKSQWKLYLLLCLQTERVAWRKCRSTSVWLDPSQRNGDWAPSPCRKRSDGEKLLQCWKRKHVDGDSDVHGPVGGAAEVLGAQAGQEALGDGFQQRFHLDLHPHVDQIFILERVGSLV